MAKNRTLSIQKAIKKFKANSGILHTAEAIRLGIHSTVLYKMRDEGIIVPLSRGIYRLTSLPSLDNQDLVSVAAAIPQGVICLISALSFHGLTSQIPRQVDVACKRGSMRPALKYPPIRIFWFSQESFENGIEQHEMDGVSVRVYSAEKTLADCFKYRKRIGIDVFVEALKTFWTERKGSIDKLMEYAAICRSAKLIRPYIESVIHE
ncbi:type IV toxin-antitoxin system AbiEi family antitoxin domain-containing protein [Chlamydiota bacterium]